VTTDYIFLFSLSVFSCIALSINIIVSERSADIYSIIYSHGQKLMGCQFNLLTKYSDVFMLHLHCGP